MFKVGDIVSIPSFEIGYFKIIKIEDAYTVVVQTHSNRVGCINLPPDSLHEICFLKKKLKKSPHPEWF